MTSIARPLSGEYAPYYETYFARLPATGELLPLLREQPAALRHLLTGTTEAEAGQPFAPGKWTVKQVLTHMIDTERVFAYRAMCIARGEQQPLPGFEQDEYVALSGAADRRLADLLIEHAAQRAATVALLAGLPPEAHTRTGTASNFPGVSVRAIAWVIAAHEAHHHHLLAAARHREIEG